MNYQIKTCRNKAGKVIKLKETPEREWEVISSDESSIKEGDRFTNLTVLKEDGYIPERMVSSEMKPIESFNKPAKKKKSKWIR